MGQFRSPLHRQFLSSFFSPSIFHSFVANDTAFRQCLVYVSFTTKKSEDERAFSAEKAQKLGFAADKCNFFMAFFGCFYSRFFHSHCRGSVNWCEKPSFFFALGLRSKQDNLIAID